MTTKYEQTYFDAAAYSIQAKAAHDQHAVHNRQGTDQSIEGPKLELESLKAEVARIDAALAYNREDPALDQIRAFMIDEHEKAALAFAKPVTATVPVPMPAPLAGFGATDMVTWIDAMQAFVAVCRAEVDPTQAIRDRLNHVWRAAITALQLLTDVRRARKLPMPSRLIQDCPPGAWPSEPNNAAACRQLIAQIDDQRFRTSNDQRVQLEVRIGELRTNIREQMARSARADADAAEEKRKREQAARNEEAERKAKHAEFLASVERKHAAAAAPLPFESEP